MIKITISIEEVKELVKSTEAVNPTNSIIEAILDDILNDIKEEQKNEQQARNPIDQFLHAISIGSATPRSISPQELYSMITDKRHELLALHTSYGNCVTRTEQQALQRRIESASKDLNTLMTIAQCR